MKNETVIFEKDDAFYLVAPVAPFDPGAPEIDELAFAEDVKKMAPNENIGWLRGQYVEADRANENGALWSAKELEIASLTPMLMPVTIMHDPRTAVGMIADTKLLTREAASVPHSRIDTTLGVWRHRFPDVWDEVAENYAAGTLMQSMECRNAYYDCGECGRRYPKLPGGAEKANWCEHLLAGETAAANTRPVRRLGNVTFTGSGLIFGSRGARGAFDQADLEVFQEEVAEFHERAKSTQTQAKRRPSTVDEFTIKRDEYDRLKADAARVPELERKVTTAEETAAKVPELETKLEQTEAAKLAAEGERDTLKKKVDEGEETARKETLSKDRMGKLGKGFVAKLGEFTKGRLDEQAGALTDEEWDNRLKELEETASVKRDEGGTDKGEGKDGKDDTFTDDETARSSLGGGNGNGGSGTEVSPEKRRSVVGGLFGASAGKKQD